MKDDDQAKGEGGDEAEHETPERVEDTISEATGRKRKDDAKPPAKDAKPAAKHEAKDDDDPADDPKDDKDAPKDDQDERARQRREAIAKVVEDEPRRARRARREEREPDLALEDERKPGKWRRRLIALVVLALGSAIVWGLGVRNHERYYLVCFPDRVEPQRGTQWPAGREPMEGTAFAAVKVPAEVDCTTRELDSRDALEVAVVDLIIARAEAEIAGAAPKLDEVNARLAQAQHLVRGRPERRAKLAKLSADVAYLRGQKGIEQATAAVKAAIAAFREARAGGSTLAKDGEAWIQHLERVLLQLAAPRPADAAPPAAPLPASRPSAPPPLPRPDGGAAPLPPPGGVLL
ncbi:MAG TPA: hypothetical protein VGQ83_10615 [Polyangia bacterium]|jgi:hypothetical protein